MRVVLFLALAMLVACQSVQRPADTTQMRIPNEGPVELHNGETRFDLLGDGTPAQAFVAYRGNFNAHGFRTVAIYLWSPSDADTAKQWLIVPRFGGPYDGDTGREIFETSEGADCTLGDLRLIQHRHASAELVVARRELGESFADPATTHFDYYRLMRNKDGVPGWPLWYFDFVRSIAAHRAYCDVNVAFEQELHLGRPGVATSEASR
jgi:hypothetical protein